MWRVYKFTKSNVTCTGFRIFFCSDLSAFVVLALHSFYLSGCALKYCYLLRSLMLRAHVAIDPNVC